MAYQKVYMDHIQSSSLLCQLSQMWRKEILCDAVIRTGTVITKAHRIVLVAACPMLQCMDGAGTGNQLEVKLSSDISQEAVTAFLQYLYEGFMMLTEDNVKHVEKIARLLQVDSVSKCCSDFYKVLQNEVGSTINHEPKFFFDAAPAEFRHVRASELLRSMQNDSAKRLTDSDDLSSRKKMKASRSLLSNQPHVVIDRLELIQSDTNGVSVKMNPVSQQRAAVSVTSRSDSPVDAQLITVSDDDQLPSPTRTAPFMKASSDSHWFVPSVRPPVSGRPSTHGLSDNKANGHSLPFDGTNLTSTPVALPASAQQSKTLASQLDVPVTRPSTSDGQIVIQPMEEERLSSPVIVDSGCRDRDSPEDEDGSKVEDGSGTDQCGVAGPEDLDVVGYSSGGNSLLPDMSIVKVEKADCEDGYSMSGLGGEDYGMAGDDGDDDISDGETYTYDTGPSSSAGDEHSTSWYTQTFRDAMHHYGGGDKGLQKIGHDLPAVSMGSPFASRFRVRDGDCGEEILKQRIVRALGLLKSPIVFMRPLQRKINGVKSEHLKAACASLSKEGFGQFVSKFESNVLQRDAFFKPAPGTLKPDDPYLIKSQVPYEVYCDNFDDISVLATEMLKVIYVAHPDQEYVKGLCKGLVEERDVLMLQKAVSSPVPYLGSDTGPSRFNASGTPGLKQKLLSAVGEKGDVKSVKAPAQGSSHKLYGHGSFSYQSNPVSFGALGHLQPGSSYEQQGNNTLPLYRDYSPHGLNLSNRSFAQRAWPMPKDTPTSSSSQSSSSTQKYLTPTAEEFASLSPSVLFERYFGPDAGGSSTSCQSSVLSSAGSGTLPMDSGVTSLDRTHSEAVEQRLGSTAENSEVSHEDKVEPGFNKPVVKTEPKMQNYA